MFYENTEKPVDPMLIGLMPVDIFAWDGMPTPLLHIEGPWLKDPTGKHNLTL